MGQQLEENVLKRVRNSPFWSILADECKDVTNNEQMSICIRYLHENKHQTTIKEDFICFLKAKRTTGEFLASLLLEYAEEKHLDLKKLRGQCYDGGSNMSGCHNGVQARVKKIYPQAEFVHCKAHCLNLSITNASNAEMRNMMNIVQKICFSFNYSPKRQTFLEEALNQDANRSLGKRGKLRSLCETRWSARADCLTVFVNWSQLLQLRLIIWLTMGIKRQETS